MAAIRGLPPIRTEIFFFLKINHELTFYEAMQTKTFPLNPFVNKGGEKKMGHPLIVRLPFFFSL